VRAAAEILDIRHVGCGSASLLGIGPGFLVRVLARLFVERDDPLARLGDVRPGAEVLQVCGIRRRGPGLLGVGPRLLVRLFERLLISRLLLRRRRLRIRGLAASREKRGAGNDGNNCRRQKQTASGGFGPLSQIIDHGWPSSTSRAFAVSTYLKGGYGLRTP